MLNELMGEINADKKKRIANQQINANVPAGSLKQTNKAKAK